MTTTRLSSLLFLILVFLCNTATTETAPKRLTWEDCIREASLHNPEIKAAQNTLASSRSKTMAAYGAFLPQLSAGWNRSESNSWQNVPQVPPPAPGMPVLDPNRPRAATSYSVSLSQDLFSGFGDQAHVRQSRSQEQSEKARLESTKAKVSYDLKISFAGMKYAQDYLKFSQNVIKRRKDNRDLINLRYKGGTENKASVLLADAYLEQANLDSTHARNEMDIQSQHLRKVLGREEEEEIQNLKISGSVSLSSPPPNPDYETLILQTPEYRLANSEIQTSKAGVTSARSAFFPHLTATGSVGKDLTENSPTTNYWAVGIGATLPIFNGGKDFYNLKGAKATLAASSFQGKNTKLEIHTKLIEAFKKFSEALRQVRINRTLVTAELIHADIAKKQYNNGLLKFDEWDRIETNLISSQKSLLESEQTQVTTEAEWERVQGRSVIP